MKQSNIITTDDDPEYLQSDNMEAIIREMAAHHLFECSKQTADLLFDRNPWRRRTIKYMAFYGLFSLSEHMPYVDFECLTVYAV